MKSASGLTMPDRRITDIVTVSTKSQWPWWHATVVYIEECMSCLVTVLKSWCAVGMPK